MYKTPQPYIVSDTYFKPNDNYQDSQCTWTQVEGNHMESG